MSLQIKTILLMLLFLALAGLIVYGLATWAGIEATKADDYFYVKGYTEQPVIVIATPEREIGR